MYSMKFVSTKETTTIQPPEFTQVNLAQTDPDLQIAGYKFRAQEMSASRVVITRLFFKCTKMAAEALLNENKKIQ